MEFSFTPTRTEATHMAPSTSRCDHRSDLGLGCARSSGHAGAHWLTAKADEAREALRRIGIEAR